MRSSKSLTSRKGGNGLDPSTPLPDYDVRKFALRISSRWQSRIARQVQLACQDNRPRELCSLGVDPIEYDSVTGFAVDYFLCSAFKKYRGFNLGIDREVAAFEKWLQAEESCRLTNTFITDFTSGGNPYPPRVVTLMLRMQRKVSEILKEVPWGFIRKSCRFGPGSDLSTDGDFTSSYNKFKTPGSSTPYIRDVWSSLFSEDRREDYLHECQFVRGDRLSFVPKTAFIDRGICTGPRWNVFLQLGIGEAISMRLGEAGLDVKLQDRNRELVARAHRSGLATLDLSSASDTVSKLLVAWLIEDDDWKDLIFKSRSPEASYRDQWYKLEKVSAMGNGYTFPLESLIFYAAAVATCDEYQAVGDIGVFGDDIILPRAVVPAFVELLSYLGFNLNDEKSYVHGRFFESCGHDYFDGENVRPFYFKERVSSVLDYMVLANQMTDYMRRRPDVAEILGLREERARVISSIPRKALLFGPVGLAGVVHSSFDECSPKTAEQFWATQGWEGWMVESWHAVPQKFRGNDYTGHLFSKLSDDLDSGESFTARNRVRWRRKKTYVPSYGDFLWL